MARRGVERPGGVGADREEGRVAEVEQAGETDDHVEPQGQQRVDRRRRGAPLDEVVGLVEDHREHPAEDEGDQGEGDGAVLLDPVAQAVDEGEHAEAGERDPHRVVGGRELREADLAEQRLLLVQRDQHPDHQHRGRPGHGEGGAHVGVAERLVLAGDHAVHVVAGAADQGHHGRGEHPDEHGAHAGEVVDRVGRAVPDAVAGQGGEPRQQPPGDDEDQAADDQRPEGAQRLLAGHLGGGGGDGGLVAAREQRLGRRLKHGRAPGGRAGPRVGR